MTNEHPVVNLIGQAYWHQDGTITMNVEGLRLLARMCASLLEEVDHFGVPGTAIYVQDTFAGDGEGYSLRLEVTIGDDWPKAHYTDEVAR